MLNPDYDYEWSVTGGEILNGENFDIKFIHVKWDTISTENSISIRQTVKETGCQLNQGFKINKLNYKSPDVNEIIRKSTSNILIIKEKSPDVHFQWGYSSVSDNKSLIIDDSDRNYVQYPEAIDTTKYSYWVISSLYYGKKDTCKAISVYSEKAIDNIVSDNVIYRIYPIPANNMINIESEFNEKTDVLIRIFSMEGKDFYQKAINGVEILRTKLDLDLPKGLYFIKIGDKNNSITQKIIIE